jgi:hypothetical protein
VGDSTANRQLKSANSRKRCFGITARVLYSHLLEPAPNYKGMNPEGESIKPEDEDEDDQDADTGNLESDENKAPRQTN